MDSICGYFRLTGVETERWYLDLPVITELSDEEMAWELNESHDRIRDFQARFLGNHEKLTIEYIPNPPELRLIKGEG